MPPYTGNAGYNLVNPSGITGRETMYGLTRALQIELGIATPADSFGPTTESYYKTWGEMEMGKVPETPQGTNMVKILQGAMY